MSSTTARLFQRLTALATSTAAFVGGQRLGAQVATAPEPTVTDGTESHTDSHVAIPKLVYGAARHGAVHLASHRSHSSHSSHSSHYSSSGGGGSYSPPAPAPVYPTPPKQRAPSNAPAASKLAPNQENRKILDQVLKKLPKIRSHWSAKVVLKNDTFFNIYDGDKVVGIVSLKAGTTLTLVEVKPEHAIVTVSASTSPVPVDSTDLIERMGGADAILAMPDDPVPSASEQNPDAKKPTPAAPSQAKSSKA